MYVKENARIQTRYTLTNMKTNKYCIKSKNFICSWAKFSMQINAYTIAYAAAHYS